MSEKERTNNFNFILYQENVMLCSKGFSADQYNPFTRYSVDIRDILPWMITKIQKVLSRKVYETTVSDKLDLYKYNQNLINFYPHNQRQSMRYKPQPIVQHIENKIIKGVECKIGLYINENPIVERIFYVDGFNPVARWSMDVVDTITDVVDIISDSIKTKDIKNMWDDYDLINSMGFTINRIRELSPAKRKELLKRIHNN